jgi:DNA-binding NarL/FixJ family response regulator
METPDSVVVCDTEPIAIEGLRSLLESADGLRVIAAETSLAEGLDAVRELQPSLLIIEKAFGLQPKTDLLQVCRRASRRTGVIIWSGSISDAEAVRFIHCGAAGAVRKTAPLDVLLHCIRTVASGGTWLEHEVFHDPDQAGFIAHAALTAREMQVMELVERGCKNKEIASALGIRIGTVKIHLKHIFEKTGIRGRYGLALSCLKEKGLLAAMSI